MTISSAIDLPPAWVQRPLKTLELRYDAASKSLWMCYRAEGSPFFSKAVLDEITWVRDSLIADLSGRCGGAGPVRYLVMASRQPGVFNLGGDLATFARAIRSGDRETLLGYALQCVELVYGLSTGFGLPIVTVAVVEGRAFGGGLEAALAEDFLIAAPDAQMSAPEVAFNSFPGMGAVSMLSRRLGAAAAEQIISSGRIYSGREMYELGVADVLASGSDATAFALAWLADGGAARFQRRLALARARRKLFPISQEELIRVTELWVDCSCQVTPADLRHMDRLVAAQKRFCVTHGAA
jgi:DSF synthase